MVRRRVRQGRERMRIRPALAAFAVVTALLAAIMALAACDSRTSGAARSTLPASAGATTSAAQTTGTEAPTVTPTTGAVTTPGAQQGTAEFCAAPANVSAQLPASVTAYPSAQFRLGQSAGGSGIYGLCTGDSTDAVARFYAAQLPAKGWQQVTTNTNAGVRQVQAAKGSAHVVITAEPDAQLSGTTEIIILTSGL